MGENVAAFCCIDTHLRTSVCGACLLPSLGMTLIITMQNQKIISNLLPDVIKGCNMDIPNVIIMILRRYNEQMFLIISFNLYNRLAQM